MIVHPPVMLREAMGMLEPGPGGIYVDATVGLGGHAEEILKLIGPEGMLIGIDRDDEALKMARERLGNDAVILIRGKFSDLKDLLRGKGIDEVDGVLFDFGVSMMQFKDAGRGFSFSSDEPLDMRMDRSQGLKAGDVVNTYPEKELGKILREYGEERLAPKIARAIKTYRAKKRITTCRELADLVLGVYRGRGKHHPATRTFQALRIEVNDEIGEIRGGLDAAAGLLRKGGRLCAISYHSLEDREVKTFIREADRQGLLRTLTKKPLTPSYDEIRGNRSARSAKLRGAERQ
jgi:16S rRNA (cytosine1402-N4)-methyltransferase